MKALAAIHATNAADWLSDMNEKVVPFLNANGDATRGPAERDAMSRLLNTQPVRSADFEQDVLNRLILYCDEHSIGLDPAERATE